MGRAKEAWTIAQQYEGAWGCVEFLCPECKELSDVEIEIPEIHEHLKLECSECGATFDAEVDFFYDPPEITLTKHSSNNVKLNIDNIYLEGYDSLPPPDNPYSIFQVALQEIRDIALSPSKWDGTTTLNRMLFMQSFSAFEAYLCDRYINLVLSNTDNIELIVNKHDVIKKATLSMPNLYSQRELSVDIIIKNIILNEIHKTSFHKFSKVITLFKIYDIEMFPNTEEQDTLFKARIYRHDCVHRNGYDSDGNELDIITKEYVLNILTIMANVATFIEDKIIYKNSLVP